VSVKLLFSGMKIENK